MINTQPTNKLYPTTKGSFLSSNSNNTHIIDLDTGEVLGLQGLPRIIEYDPTSKFADIKSPGRNNALLTYSGSEDVIEFEVSWYTVTLTKTDVLERCKWLEIMTKADGYLGRPHFCRLNWGKMFAKSIFVVVSAKYTMKDFDKPSGMYPICATQRVVLKRYTLTNSTHEQISDVRW